MPRAATTTDVFNAIGDTSRRDILDAIGSQEITVSDLVAKLRLSQPLVSKHLAVLRTVGLVLVRTEQRNRWYRINGLAIKPIQNWMHSFERNWNARLDRLDNVLAEMETQEKKS
jgi:DNA-binding transcriptional ArsR family regulator